MTDYGTNYTDKEFLRVRRELESLYAEAQKDLEKKLQDFYDRFNVKIAIYENKYKKGEITEKQFESWKQGQIFQETQWKSKINEIVDETYRINQIATDIINRETYNIFAENANYQSYILDHEAGVSFGFGLYDTHTVANLIKNNPEILPPKKLNKEKDKAWNMKKIRSQIALGIIEGEKLDEIAERIAKVTGSQNKNAMLTHARTAMTAAQNAGRNQSLMDAKNLGIDLRKEWMATLDNHTRDTHARIDGEKQKVGDKWHPMKFSNGCRFPGDPLGPPREVYNCRCTLVADVVEFPDGEYERYDNISGRPIKNMTYSEWKKYREMIFGINLEDFQSKLGKARTVQEVNDLMNNEGWWAKEWDPLTGKREGAEQRADLTGCDLDSAKAIASAYDQVFKKYPQLKGYFDPPDAHPIGMSSRTYAWCYTRAGGKVQVNPRLFNNWDWVERRYRRDVLSGWHPYGTTAESIITHEIGHGIDGLLAKEGILGGYTASGEFRTASSTLRSTVMRRVAKEDPIIGNMIDVWGFKGGSSMAINDYVSEYATRNPREWFAECFAEYITSANPRSIATELGKELERLLGRLK